MYIHIYCTLVIYMYIYIHDLLYLFFYVKKEESNEEVRILVIFSTISKLSKIPIKNKRKKDEEDKEGRKDKESLFVHLQLILFFISFYISYDNIYCILVQ